MMFVAPMLARPLPKDFRLESDTWCADEKYDGHRLIVQVSQGMSTLFTKKGITAWSRYGLERQLPTHLLEVLAEMPDGIYDGELLVPGKRSYGVTELVNGPDLRYFIFDLIQFEATDVTPLAYVDRQQLLKNSLNLGEDKAVVIAPSTPINSWEELITLRDEIWARDGEGLILKRMGSIYQPGKRSKDFIKIKALRSAVLTVVGFQESMGLIMNRGPYAITLLEDEEGNRISVKTRNDQECYNLAKAAEGVVGQHPFIGRHLRIEYQERTPDGSYRHPRWDRWEND